MTPEENVSKEIEELEKVRQCIKELTPLREKWGDLVFRMALSRFLSSQQFSRIVEGVNTASGLVGGPFRRFGD